MKKLLRSIIGGTLGILLLLTSSAPAYARIIFVDDTFENNSEIFQIGANDDATTTNLSLEFGGTNSESLLWNTTAFTLSDDLNVSGSGTFTVADTQNQVGITVNQNDITNNPAAISIANTGTGNDITATNWNITKAGIITGTTLTDGTATITGGTASGLTGITSGGSINFSAASAINIPFTDSATFTLDNDNAGVGANVDIIANQGADLDGTLRYNATTNQWELSNNGGTFDPITTGLRQTASAVQARQAGAFSLASATWVDITFDTTDIETNSAVLQHNVTTTSRIDIKETGLYLISYNLNLDEATATGTWDSRVLVNGVTPVNGSVQANSNYQGEYVASNPTFYASLTANDYITLQAQRVTANTLTKVSDPTLTIVKMEGIKGAKGDQGLPGSVGLGTNETTFTLDQDNVGAGVNTDIISNQGTGLDGTLRYDTTDNRWKISNDAGGFFDIHQASVFYAYDGVGGQAINATEITVNIDTTVVSDPIYSLALDEVTVSEAGLYKITGKVGTDDINTAGGARITNEIRIQNNAVDIAGAVNYCYHRETTSNTCEVSIVTNLAASDVIRLRTIRLEGTTNAQTRLDASSLMIERIR